mmetsp:Transcript_11123/g.21350  ORF Transcript_11123/g.21350 Transcript_11123/m.21350 type:complete len:216 (+) Transcript_11123:55-702(+)
MPRATASSSRPTSARPRPSTRIEGGRHVRFPDPASHRAALGRAARGAGHGRARRVRRAASAHRRGARHHQCAGADQHRRTGLLAAGGRAAHQRRDRGHDGRPAAAHADALAVALRAVAGHRRVPGRHRHLLRAPARHREAAAGPGRPARRAHAGARADRDRPWRDQHVDGGSQSRRAQARWPALCAGRPARDPGLDRQAPAAHRARRHRDQHHWR